jgi:flagellar motility protein MotE (MotC chaperone)
MLRADFKEQMQQLITKHQKEIEQLNERIKTITETAKYDYEKRMKLEKIVRLFLKNANTEQLAKVIIDMV